MDSSSTTFKVALCGAKYRKATWICFILNCIAQLVGSNAINGYAKRLLQQMEEQGGGFGLTPLQGTYIIGASNMIASLLALGMISIMGRRTIYILG